MDSIEVPLFTRRSAAAVSRRLLSLSWMVFGAVTMWAATARDCGPAALTVVAAQMKVNTGGRRLLAEVSPPADGFSLAQLRALGVAAGLELVPVQRAGDGPLPIPSIAHWREGHYVAVLAADESQVIFQDNATGTPRRVSEAAFLGRCSGHFLVLAERVPPNWQSLPESEARRIRGMGLTNDVARAILDDDDDEDCPTDEEPIWFPEGGDSPASADPVACPEPERCPPGQGDEECGLGMPVWRVSEPFVNLWVKDVPLYYPMSNGRILPFILRYRQRNETDASESTNVFSVGKSWECSWLAYMEQLTNDQVRFRVPGGGRRTYALETPGLMGERVSVNNGQVGYSMSHRTVCKVELQQPHTVGGTTLYLLSAQQDPHGRLIQFRYETNAGVIRLTQVIDFDGRTNTLAYGLTNAPRLVTSVTDPYGRSAWLSYDTSGNLTGISDMQGLSSQFEYDDTGLLTQMTTPYGTTYFAAVTCDQDTNQPIARGLRAILPNGATNLYVYRDHTDSLPSSYDQPTNYYGESFGFPETSCFHRRNTFFWDARQMEAVSTPWTNLVLQTNIAAPEFHKARLRHWAWTTKESGATTLTRKLLLERGPSPDGTSTNTGTPVWYMYEDPNKTIWPTLRAQRLPNGQSRYTRWDRNDWGHATNVISSYTDNGAVGERTASYSYEGADGRTLTQVQEPDSEGNLQPARAYAYNERNQLTNATLFVHSRSDCWSESTTYTYANHVSPVRTNGLNLNLTSIRFPNGLILTNSLDTNSFQVTNRLWYTNAIGGTPLATNRFTWANGKISTSTDARNLTVTRFWDALGRLTGLGYPDGSTVSNRYVKLDRTQTKDRLGGWTLFGYDNLHRLTAVTNALGNVTRYDWCTCGALDSVTDPLGNATTYDYDLAGRLRAVHYPGTNRVLHVDWNQVDEPTELWDNLGSLTLTFNHQGLWTGASNSFGLWRQADYDLNSRPTNVIVAGGQRAALEYDSVGRVLRREMVTTNGSSVESFGYTMNVAGAIAYTNQLGTGITLLAYDLFGRLTNGVFVGLATNRFSYTAAGDLASLVDGKNQTTAWGYDAEGRPFTKTIAGQLTWSNAYNSNGWLTTHWTPARSNVTTYTYDAMGNVTGIANSSGLTTNVALTYDQNNRLKTMTDAAGNTTFTWSELGTLAGEDGPWVSDTISFGYNDTGLRQALTLVQPNASPWMQAYAYDGNWRLKELTSPAGGFTNTFLGASRRLKELALANGSVVTDTYDDLGRLLSTVLKNAGGGVLNAHAYGYDAAHQRTNQTLAEGNWWQYGYDAMGQLTGAQGREAGGTVRAHEQLSYGYDAAGNLIGRTNNGFAQTFTLANGFNQLDSVSRSGTFTAAGLVQSAINVTVTVKVNAEGTGTNATVYADKSFARSGITVIEGTNAFTAVATDSNGRLATNAASAWLPTSASFVYDQNGNLTSDGRRGFSYDDFDQLTSVTVTNAWRSEFAYDALGRRRVRTEKVWKNSQWVTTSETRYVYDHMLVVQERDALNLPTATYTRGLDLSGGLQRAGGIGGLLALTQPSPINPQHFYYHADAGGNVTALTDARQAVVARYRYDPFGNLLGLSGPMAEANPYRFSSKEWHANSGLYYYGYRFYEPSLQRWVNRDPIAHFGGHNLYLFVFNAPAAFVDPHGLRTFLCLYGEDNSDVLRNAAYGLAARLANHPCSDFDPRADRLVVRQAYNVDELSQALEEYPDIGFLGICSHGGVGALYLGLPSGSNYNLSPAGGPAGDATDPTSIYDLPTGGVLPDAEIHIYACDAATSPTGTESIASAFADHYGAPVTAAGAGVGFTKAGVPYVKLWRILAAWASNVLWSQDSGGGWRIVQPKGER